MGADSGVSLMGQMPTLETPRLVLRPFTLADAPAVQQLAGEREIAVSTINIPHPYEDGLAEQWIGTHQAAFERGDALSLAVTLKPAGVLAGAIALHIDQTHHLAEMGYWIGRPHWNQGYCTEAAREMIRHAFEELGLNRVQARHLARNPASGRVMQKTGMTYEGLLRQSLCKWGSFEDAAVYAILRDEYSRGLVHSR